MIEVDALEISAKYAGNLVSLMRQPLAAAETYAQRKLLH